MRTVRIFVLIILILLIAAYTSTYYYLNNKGKDIIERKLTRRYGSGQIESFVFKFPFTIEIKRLACGDVYIEQAKFVLGSFNPLTKRLGFSEVYLAGLKAKFIRDKEKIVFSPFFLKEIGKDKAPNPTGRFTIIPLAYAASTPEPKRLAFAVKKFRLKDGTIEVVNNALRVPLTMVYKDINLELDNFVYPELKKFRLKLSSSLQVEEFLMEDIISASGSVDFFRKDMNVDLTISDVNLLAFNDYIVSYLRPRRWGLNAAVLSAVAGLVSINNELSIDCVFYIDKVDFSDDQEYFTKVKLLKEKIIPSLKGQGLRPQLSIGIKDKMYPWAFNLISLKEELTKELTRKVSLRGKDIVAQAVGQTKDAVVSAAKGTVEGAAEVTVDVSKEIVEAGIEAIKDIGEKFKKIPTDTQTHQ